jgi:hypothetical protein
MYMFVALKHQSIVQSFARRDVPAMESSRQWTN